MPNPCRLALLCINCRHLFKACHVPCAVFLLSNDVHLTRVQIYVSGSQPLPCAFVQLHTKPTTRRRTPVCHNSSQATALNLGRALTSFPIIMHSRCQPYQSQIHCLWLQVIREQASKGKRRPCITRRVSNSTSTAMCMHTRHVNYP